MTRVLVLGGRTAIALQVARALWRAGAFVVAADGMHSSVTRFSRATRAFARVPPPASDPARYVDAVAAIVARHAIDRVVPTGEERLWLALAAERGHALPVPVVGALPIDRLARLHDKRCFQQVVAASGLEPLQTLPATPDAVAATVAAAGRAVVKPRGQRFGRGVVVVDGTADLHAVADVDAVVQPFVEGEERCGFVLADRGRVRVATTYLPTWRFPLGPSFGFTPVHDDALVDAMGHLVERQGLDGAFGVDAIARPDGSLALLECNPRFTSGVHLVDDDTLASALLGGPPGAPASIRSRGGMVAPAMLLCARPQRPVDVLALLRDFWRSDDVVWDRRDPLPSVAFLGVLGELAWTAHRERIPARFATSHQLAWDPACWPLDHSPSGAGGTTAAAAGEGATDRSRTPLMSTYASSHALQVP